MSLPFPTPDRGPTRAELSAWADGELVGPAARRVEAWLAGRPEAAAEVEQARRLTQLYRDHPAPEPAAAAWRTTLDGIESRLRPAAAPGRRPRPWPWRLVLSLVGAAALLGGVALARALWPTPEDAPPVSDVAQVQPPVPPPSPEADDEVFPVASAGEVDILSIDPRDADRLALGGPVLGAFDLAAVTDIEVIAREPEDGLMPRLYGGHDAKVPLVVVAPEDETEP